MNWITCLITCLLIIGEIAGQDVPMTQRWWLNFPNTNFAGHAIAHDSRSIIAVAGTQIIVFDALTGDTIVTWRGHDNSITSIDASPINDFFATCSNTEVKVWALNTRSLVQTIPVIAVLPGGNGDVFISPTGRKVGLGWSGHGHVVFDVLTGDSLWLNEYVSRCIVLPDDSTMLIAISTGPSTYYVRVVNIYTQAVVDEYRFDKSIHNMDLSADGRYVLVSLDETVYLIDREVKNIVWSKSTSQTLDDGATAMITRGGGHVFLGRLPGASGEIVGMQLIHWPTNTEIGRWPNGTAPGGRLAPDSSFFSAAHSVTTYAVNIGWLPTSVTEVLMDTIVVESTDAGIRLRQVPESIATFEWSMTDISGRRVASGNSVRVADTFVIVPQPKPAVGVYILQCSAASGVIGSWTISLN